MARAALVDVQEAVVVVLVAVDSHRAQAGVAADMPAAPAVAVALPAAPVVALAALVVDVQVPVAAARRPVHSVVPVVSRPAVVRASAPSAKSSTTCRRHHPRVRFVRWVRVKLFACPVARA